LAREPPDRARASGVIKETAVSRQQDSCQPSAISRQLRSKTKGKVKNNRSSRPHRDSCQPSA